MTNSVSKSKVFTPQSNPMVYSDQDFTNMQKALLGRNQGDLDSNGTTA